MRSSGAQPAAIPDARFALVVALIALFTLVRIATTHRVFSQTSDEPFHVAAGYDFLKKGTQTIDLQHPPLARVLFALPFLDTPSPKETTPIERGNALLLQNDRYTQNLWRARAGNLLFVALAVVVVAMWAAHAFSPWVGIVAALLYASLPPVLAHGGLATTDMAAAATLSAALFALVLFLEAATWRRTIILAVAIAAGALAKYSFVAFFPPCAILLVIARRRFPVARIAVALLIAFVLVWGTYRFSFSTLAVAYPEAAAMCEQAFGSPRMATAVSVPAPIYVLGAVEVARHDREGHKAFLFGEMSTRGWWYYFPVAVFFKTPIPFLFLTLAGFGLFATRRLHLEIPLLALAILGVAMASHINIGVRHVLPLYTPMAIAAGYAIVETGRLRLAAIAGAAWLVIGSLVAHPDYLPWFNAFAPHPERILNDSNLDWGQDVLRLVRTTREMHIESMTVSLFTNADLDRVGLPRHRILEALDPVSGWLAISEMQIAQGNAYSPEVRRWLADLLRGRPYRRIGKSIRLYNLPAGSSVSPKTHHRKEHKGHKDFFELFVSLW